MLDLVAVMYMYCHISASSPNISPNKVAEKSIVQVYPELVPPVVQAPQQNNESDNTPIDYVSELKNLGYYDANSQDDNLNLRNAVLHFQSAHNLEVDGVWGDQSLAELRKHLKSKDFVYRDTISQPPSEGKWIAINKSKRILTLYQNTSVIKKYPIAVGNPSTLTPEGKFTIVCKVKNPVWGGGGYAAPVAGGSPNNPLGYRWMGLSVGGGGSYGVHGNNSPYSIGLDVSHGCIRMINSDVESLFDIVPVGINIWIGTENQLSEWGISQPVY